ncbi:CBS domain-containing protein [Prauserella oleivorans]
MTTPGNAELGQLVATMIERHHRTVPVVDSGRLVGIVTRSDVVRALSRDDESIAREIRRRLTVYGGPDRWEVDVADGVVTIGDTRDSPEDRHVATLLAESVPGVVRAEAVHRAGDEA